MNIRTLLARGPGPVLEFMPEPDADELAETISAFSNGVGGTIVVGLDRQGNVNQDASEYLEPILARALRMCEPPFRAIDLPEWRTESTPSGPVTTISVRPVAYRICVGDYLYMRSGSVNIRLSPDQDADAPRASATTAYEEELVPGATVDDFDQIILDEYRRHLIRRGPRGESLSQTELLREAGAIDPTGAPTVAGVLLFGKHPEHFLPQVGIVFVRFRGSSVHESLGASERYSRRVEVFGPAPRIIERIWDILSEETRQESYLEGLQRKERFDYPPDAVREAVVNAVVHRDYAISGQRIEIRLFDDHLEIISPGGLPGHITLENIVDDHYSRNPRLVRGLYYWGYIEELGQGVDIIYAAMRRAHQPAPEYRDTGRSLSLTLHNDTDQIQAKYGELLNLRQLKVLHYLDSHDRITNRQYRTICSEVSAETLRLDLRDMCDKDILLRIGDKRGTYYILK